jgi:hypothetical protein
MGPHRMQRLGANLRRRQNGHGSLGPGELPRPHLGSIDLSRTRGPKGNVRKSGQRQVPRRGRKANRPPPLENPPRGPWPFSSYTHEVSCGQKLLQEQKGDGWGGLLKKIQGAFSGSSCWPASAKPRAAPTGEPTKPVGAVLAGPKEKGVRLIT